MKDNYVLFWHRRDVRIEDNIGLYKALTCGSKVIPLFIFDKDILSNLPQDDARVTFIHEELEKINNTLQENYGVSFMVQHGNPLEIFHKLTQKFTITAVYTNHDYEPYAIARDEKVREFLATKNIAFHSFKDQVIFERNEIVKADGKPYTVYTPYSKRSIHYDN